MGPPDGHGPGWAFLPGSNGRTSPTTEEKEPHSPAFPPSIAFSKQTKQRQVQTKSQNLHLKVKTNSLVSRRKEGSSSVLRRPMGPRAPFDRGALACPTLALSSPGLLVPRVFTCSMEFRVHRAGMNSLSFPWLSCSLVSCLA